MRKFYNSLNNRFQFNLGKILLAISSKSQLQDMMYRDWPYFEEFRHEVEQCLREERCQSVGNIIHDIGKH